MVRVAMEPLSWRKPPTPPQLLHVQDFDAHVVAGAQKFRELSQKLMLSHHGGVVIATSLVCLFTLIMVITQQRRKSILVGEEFPSFFVKLVGHFFYYGTLLGLPAFVIFYVIGYLYIFLKTVVGMYIYGGHLEWGFHTHVISGSLYFIAGALQFFEPLRQHYPHVHRFFGYVYYAMVVVTSVGICWLCIKPHAGLSAQIAAIVLLPQWIWCHWLSFRAIAVHRNVELHRQLNIVGLAFAAAITSMRLMVVCLMMYEPSWSFERALGLALWIAMTLFFLVSVWYVYLAHILPSSRRPRLQCDGTVILTGTGTSLTSPAYSLPACITSFAMLDTNHRTVLIGINITSQVDVHFPPGAHLALTVNGITREYSPIAGYLHVEAATGIPNPHIEIMIRMVPNGALSGLLNQLLSLDTCGSSAIPLLGVTMPCHVPCTVYGPLYPAPATFGYLPYYLPPPRITSAAVTASSSTPVPMLVMIAGGSGITAFFPIIEAALRNPRDKRKLRLLCLIGSSRDDIKLTPDRDDHHPSMLPSNKRGEQVNSIFENTLLEHVQLLHASMTKNQIEGGENRFEALVVTKGRRFEVDMLMPWLGSTNPQSPGTGGNTTATAPPKAVDTDKVVYWICGPPIQGASIRTTLLKDQRLTTKNGSMTTSPEQIFVLGVDDR